jgi:acetyltransferase-like isoleucine patch superfamily enzyme
MGWCLVFPRKLIMEEYSSIGHLTVCNNIDLLHLKSYAAIGRLNWITGYPSDEAEFYEGLDRTPELVLGEHSAITNRHLIDCTNAINIGPFSTVAGYRSQVLTHSIDLALSRQSARPISIGSYCFIGTDCVVLGGSTLPDFSVLAAKSLLNHSFSQTHYLYGGVPSIPIRALPNDLLYFKRQTGRVT